MEGDFFTHVSEIQGPKAYVMSYVLGAMLADDAKMSVMRCES